jgi:predicted alpha/beta superfamily hydrolase
MSDKFYYVPEVETHLVDSKDIDQTFKIQVMQPLTRKHGRERFPVLYLTDGNYSFDFAKGISHCLQATGEVARYILVAIGYPGDNPFAGSVLRCRDLTPAHRAEVPEWRRSRPIEGVPDIAVGKKCWHGATEFLGFIENEIRALVDERYPVVVGERAYFGHSLGGALGLHALFSRSKLFSRYVISSPDLFYDGDDHGIAAAREFIASGERLDAKVLMTVGGDEEFEADKDKCQFVSSFYRLAALLRQAHIPGLEFSHRLFDGETHASVWPVAFSHGARSIFGPADVPPLMQRE